MKKGIKKINKMGKKTLPLYTNLVLDLTSSFGAGCSFVIQQKNSVCLDLSHFAYVPQVKCIKIAAINCLRMIKLLPLFHYPMKTLSFYIFFFPLLKCPRLREPFTGSRPPLSPKQEYSMYRILKRKL